MRIHITGDFYISSDKLGFYIEKKSVVDVKDKDTKEVTGQAEKFDILGSYTTLQNAVEAYATKWSLVDSTAGTLFELVQEIKATREMIQKQLNGGN